MSEFTWVSGNRAPQITINRKQIRLNVAAKKAINHSELVQVGVDIKGKKIAIKATKDQNVAQKINHPKRSGGTFSMVKVSSLVLGWVGLDDAGEVQREGYFDSSENALIFDFSEVESTNKKKLPFM